MKTPVPALFFIDRSARGRLRLTGRDRQTFLQGMVSNDIVALTPGTGCYAFLLDPTGHVLSDPRVLCAENYLLVDVEPGTAEFVAQTLDKYHIMEKCRITNVSDQTVQITVGGADVAQALAALGVGGLDGSVEGANAPGTVGTAGDTLAASVRWTVGAVYDLYAPVGELDRLIHALRGLGATPISEELFEGLRIEAGVPRFGVDMDSRVLAPETGQQARAISYRKGCYIGQEIVARVHARGRVNRSLVGILLTPGALPEAGTPVVAGGSEVGRITSAVHSSTLDLPIALGYIRHEFADLGTPVTVNGTDARVAALPFGAAL